MDYVHTLNCYMDIDPKSPSVHLGGNELPYYDAVIPRIGASVTFYGSCGAEAVRDDGVLPAQ